MAVPRYFPPPPAFGFIATLPPGTYNDSQEFARTPPWIVSQAIGFFNWKEGRVDMLDGIAGHLNWTWTIDRTGGGGTKSLLLRTRIALVSGSIMQREVADSIAGGQIKTLELNFDFPPARHIDTVQFQMDAGNGPGNQSRFQVSDPNA